MLEGEAAGLDYKELESVNRELVNAGVRAIARKKLKDCD